MIQVGHLVYFLAHSKCSRNRKCCYYRDSVSEISSLHDFRALLSKTVYLFAAAYDPFNRGLGISFYNNSSNFKQPLGKGNAFVQIYTELLTAIRLFLNLEFGIHGGIVSRILNIKNLKGGKHRKGVVRVTTF